MRTPAKVGGGAPPRAGRTSAIKSVPTFHVFIHGVEYRFSVLAAKPTRPLPHYACVARSRTSGHHLRVERVFSDDARAEDFTVPFLVAASRLAEASAACWTSKEGRDAARGLQHDPAVSVSFDLRSAVTCALDDFAPPSRKPEPRVLAPAVAASHAAYLELSELMRERGAYLGQFDEAESDRLRALAEDVAQRQGARIAGGDSQ